MPVRRRSTCCAIFATHLLVNIRTVQLSHHSIKTTMIYTHVLNRGGRGVQNPADLL